MEMKCVLNDKDIASLFESGINLVDPIDTECLQPASVDLRLGHTKYEYKLAHYTLGEKINEDDVNTVDFSDIDLLDGKTAFVSIEATINMPPNLMGLVLPRSSMTRLGVVISPVFINPGYSGKIPLTIVNHSGMTVKLIPNVRVAQIFFFHLSGNPSKLYADRSGSKYFGEEASSSLLHKDKEMKSIISDILDGSSPTLLSLVNGKIA